MGTKSFKEYVTGLATATITTGSDPIPFYDNASGEIKKGTITNPEAWTSFGTALSGTGGSGATASVISARVNYLGYFVFFEIHATVTSKGTCTGDFTILGPYTPSGTIKYNLSGGVYASGGITNRGIPYADSGFIKFISSAPSTVLDWSAISVGDLIFISGFYEI